MKQKISIAAGSLKPIDKSRTHYTTLGFGCPFPIFVEEAINKDKFRMRVSNFSRLAPMYLPNLGTLQLKMHAFYVPFRLVWNHFENFREGLPSWNSKGAHVFKNVPLIDDQNLTDLFIDNNPSRYEPLAVEVTEPHSPYDFHVYFGGEYKNFRFSSHGKNVYHMLTALGYNFKFITGEMISRDGYENIQYSALPLLCWLKIFLDYFIPSQLQPSSYINQLLNQVHDMTASSIQTPISYVTLVDCINEVSLYYQNNYFTSAWMSPNAPVPGLNNIGTTSSDKPLINSVKSQSNSNSDDYYKQPVSNTSSGVYSDAVNEYDSLQLSADGLTFLQKFARYVKRSNFAGSRAVERILARFGVRVEDFQVGMCRYLGSETLTLQKSDVTVTGNTQEAGEFVGKGFFSGGSERIFKCDCDLAGMVFVTASLETPSVFVEGIRRRNLHKTPLDFYTPELDGGTMQAISGCEIYQRNAFMNDQVKANLETMGLRYQDTFGFTPRYSEYAQSLDDITGDFALLSQSQNIDAFILPRRLFDNDSLWLAITGGNATDYSLRFAAYDSALKSNTAKVTPVQTLRSNDMAQFNRIFKDRTGLSDPVFSVFRIDCVVHSVKQPLNESAEIIGRGKALDFETNGVHLS